MFKSDETNACDGLIISSPNVYEHRNRSELYVSTEEIVELQERAKNVNRANKNTEIIVGRKMCPTRHGCQGATNCNYTYADYPG